VLVRALAALCAAHCALCFAPASGITLRWAGQHGRGPAAAGPRLARPTLAAAEEEQWQAVAERLADPFVSPFDKPAILLALAQRAPAVTASLADVVQGKEAPEMLLGPRARQQVKGAQAVSRQLTQDILPDALPQVQRLLEETAANPQQPVANLGSSVSAGFVRLLDDLTATGRPPALPRFEDIASEAKQIFESTPSELETPNYTLLEKTPDFELREYTKMTVAVLDMQPRETARGNSAGGPGNGFQTLAAFLFGENSKQEAMAMTTPVITQAGVQGASKTMSFVIPTKYGDAETAPQPFNGTNIQVQDVPSQKVATREFAGFATDQEVVRQGSQLVSALQAAGWTYQGDVSTVEVQVLQYNPPYTLPTLRRNEVLVKLADSWVPPAVAGDEATETEITVGGTDASDTKPSATSAR